MKAIELFAGGGGAALGLEAAGVEHAALCEWDADACATLRAAGLGPVVEGDVRDLDAIAAVAGESCDLLWSSFPCQAWSVAGKRKGAQDERNGWPWTVDAIDRFRPTWVLAENVRGLTFHTRKGGCGDPERCPGCYLEQVIMRDLRERFAYAGRWVLDAADYGVPQHRRRLILWAGPQPLKAPVPTHVDPQKRDLIETRPPWATMGEALGLVGTALAFEREDPSRGWEGIKPGPSPSVRAGRPGGGLRIIGGGRNPTSSPGDLTNESSTTVAASQIGNAGPWVIGSMRNSLQNPNKERPVLVDCEPSPTVGTKGNMILSRPSPTIIGGSGESHINGRSVIRSQAVRDALPRRRLTVEECARLQDFPARYPWQGTKTSRYRQVGNAVPPTLARVVAEVLP